MGPDELEWLDISDFSPGIWDEERGLSSQTAPDGAATAESYGCVNDGVNGLKGAPLHVETIPVDVEPWMDKWSYFLFYSTPGSNNEAGEVMSGSPDLENHRLIDFEITKAVKNYPTEDVRGYTAEEIDGPIGNTRGSGTVDDVEYSAVVIGTVTQGWISREANSDVAYSNFNVCGHYSSTTERFLGTYARWLFEVDEDVDGSHWKYGFADIELLVWYSPEDTRDAYPDWSFGVPVFAGTYGHWLDGGYYLNQSTGAKNLGSGQFVIGGHQSIAVPFAHAPIFFNSEPDVDPSEWGERSSKISFTHSTGHGGRHIAVATPTSDTDYDWDYASNPDASGVESSNYTKQIYQNGFVNWDANLGSGGGLSFGSRHLHSLHYSLPGPIGEPDTSLGKNASLLGLGASGFLQVNTLTSVNASRLFVTTTNSGAIVVDGDITSPNINSLPGVESTYGLTPRPSPMAGGVAYGSASGIFLWDGGEEAELISPQLHGRFWVPDEMDRNELWHDPAPRGRMAYRWPYLYVPNGYIYNAESGGWWRLTNYSPDSEAEILPSLYRVDQDGYVWAATHYLDTDQQDPAGDLGESFAITENTPDFDTWPLHKFDPEQESLKWLWVSQPLSVSRNRFIEMRELALTIQTPTNATWNVYVIKDGAVVALYDLDLTDITADVLQTVSLPVSVTGTNLQVGIGASCTSGSARLRRLSIGWRSAERIPHNVGAS